MKKFRNRALSLYEEINEHFRTLIGSDKDQITLEEARDKYCDLWEEAIEHLGEYGHEHDHLETFIQIMKDVRVDIERI